MRKILSTLLFILVSVSSSAQGWLPIVTRMYLEYNGGFGWRIVNNYHLFRYIRIQGKDCSWFQNTVMEESYQGGHRQTWGPGPGKDEFLYEEDRKVYYLNQPDSSFVMIFNFAAEVGEEWRNPLLESSDSITLKVVYVGDTIIDTTAHHYQILQFDWPGEGGGGMYSRRTVIEGIGALDAPFLTPDPMSCSFMFLRCFENKFESHQFVQDGCDITSGVEELWLSKLKIHPNPVKDMLNIEAPESLGPMQLIDIQGKVVKQFSIDRGSNVLNIDELPFGTYQLVLSNMPVAASRTIIKQ